MNESAPCVESSGLSHARFQIPVPTWWDDPSDVELLDILPLLERLEKAESIYEVLKHEDTSSEPLLDRKQ